MKKTLTLSALLLFALALLLPPSASVQDQRINIYSYATSLAGVGCQPTQRALWIIRSGASAGVYRCSAANTFTAVGNSGDTAGPTSSTDNAIARFDSTTGKLLQNSPVLIGDTGNVTGLGTLNTHTIPAGTSTFGMLGLAQTWSGNQTYTGKILMADGAYNLPAYSFTNNTGSGMVLDGAGGNVYFSTNGGVRLYLMSNKVRVLNQVTFSADPGSTDGTSGLGIFEAGIAKFTNGTTGNGTFKIGDPGTKPTCDVTRRFTFWADEGGAGIKDTVEVCAKAADDSYAWRTIY